LQIFFYYDIIVEGYCYIIYLLNFYSGSSMCPVTALIIQGCGARRKNDTVLAPPPEMFVFMSVAPELFFFMAPSSGRFHTLIFY